MPKVRFVEAPPPSFGLVGDAARARVPEPTRAPPPPPTLLASTHGQRFVAMVRAMTELAHLNLSDNEATEAPPPASLPPAEEPDAAAPHETILYPRIKIPGPKQLKRRKRRRPKRTWETSHATWTGTPSVDPFFVLQYDSAIERASSLAELDKLRPVSRAKLPARAMVASHHRAHSNHSSSSSSTSSDEPSEPAIAPSAPRPTPLPKPFVSHPPKVKVVEATTVVGNNAEDDVVSPPSKLLHVPTVLTPEMVQWLRNSGMFVTKPRSQVAWTRDGQLAHVGHS
ncbi:hypothetical protein SDRG_05566 [Saprolegnia diclina VS20]|uniref:Uncharacterized protein n=1 Tax=Saprolegnia diclina (strain VS20) TaxID=1156394 RepID=T0QHB3_SAPDV|nr:hypothetical protein SDRG_05566 [Saprolegnia diclina VS20]EQC37349.1 hypothetical protein SDRG_05566 [Saprolegnia diclina VS20]|eukprot:XP_008609511.1 hypothetical protein SDRG_05566 [Saprolegnia diclina VS20]